MSSVTDLVRKDNVRLRVINPKCETRELPSVRGIMCVWSCTDVQTQPHNWIPGWEEAEEFVSLTPPLTEELCAGDGLLGRESRFLKECNSWLADHVPGDGPMPRNIKAVQVGRDGLFRREME